MPTQLRRPWHLLRARCQLPGWVYWRRRPPSEINVSHREIRLGDRDELAGISLIGFDIDAVRDACIAHGWTIKGDPVGESSPETS
ncbi:MAG: hypothetical protein ACRDZZ_05335 [Ilumatobacteraceae bacterium]